MRNALRALAADRDEWAGIPMPLEDTELIVEPRYRFAAAFPRPKVEEPDGVKHRNTWWSTRLKDHISIWEEPDGRITGGRAGHRFTRLSQDLQTLGVSPAWGIEQEGNAVHPLGEVTRHHQFKQYLLTGMFLERSLRSGLTYMFRRLKPTVVLDARDMSATSTRVLCTLCLHPIAYYAGSWAGAMCPTDDVIAHLMLMRGDEPLFWRRANQHAPDRPESAL